METQRKILTHFSGVVNHFMIYTKQKMQRPLDEQSSLRDSLCESKQVCPGIFCFSEV